MAAGTEHDAVRSVVLDYLEGWFEGDADRMRRALHPEFVKRCRGTIRQPSGISIRCRRST